MGDRNASMGAVRTFRGTGGFLLNPDTEKMRDPHTVRSWLVNWVYESRAYALKGDFDFAADMAAALKEAERDGLVRDVELIPCAKATPALLYKRAYQFRMDLKSNDVWRFWDNLLDEYGYELPDVFQLMRLSNAKKGFYPG